MADEEREPEELTPEELLEHIRRMKVSDLLLSTISTVAQLGQRNPFGQVRSAQLLLFAHRVFRERGMDNLAHRPTKCSSIARLPRLAPNVRDDDTTSLKSRRLLREPLLTQQVCTG